MAYKYIVIKNKGEEVPFIFPDVFYHDKIADKLALGSVVSAGCVNFNNKDVECYGKSTGLNLKSREDVDSKLIKSFY